MTVTPYAGGPYSYLDTPTAAPLGIVELMPGARNLIEYCGVEAGERVLVIAEHTVDPVVIQAISAAAAYRDADVHVLSSPPFSPGGWDLDVPSPFLAAAYAEADVVISLVWWAEVHSKPLFFSEVPKHKARFVSLHMTATAGAIATGGRLPPEVFYVLLRKAQERMEGSGAIRVTTEHGTDVTFARMTFTPDEGPMKAGNWRPWPLGGINGYPESTDGVIVVEDSTVTGVPEQPLRIELADNVVTKIEGGMAADQTRRYAPGGYYMRHALLGLNPKVRIANGSQFEREKHAGAFYCGIDALTREGGIDASVPGHAHNDIQFDRPTVEVDGEPISVRGRLVLLDDPEVREVAARFGPPEVVLDDNPQMILPRRHTGVPANGAGAGLAREARS